MLLVVVQHRPARRRPGCGSNHQQNMPVSARNTGGTMNFSSGKDHRQARSQHQQVPRSGLFHDQQTDRHRSRPAAMKSSGRNGLRTENHYASIQRRRDLQVSLGWITTRRSASAGRPFFVMPNATATRPTWHGKGHQPLRRNLSHHKHDGASDQRIC
jgi:hypothetical protein